MNWDALDFIVFGALVAGVVFATRFAFGRSSDRRFRWGMLIAIAGSFLLLWSNGAVGIIGGASNDINLLFSGVPAAGLLGGFIGRFRAAGMMFALFGMGIVQVLIPLAALALTGFDPSWSLVDVVWLTVFFTAIWIASALCFRASARSPYF